MPKLAPESTFFDPLVELAPCFSELGRQRTLLHEKAGTLRNGSADKGELILKIHHTGSEIMAIEGEILATPARSLGDATAALMVAISNLEFVDLAAVVQIDFPQLMAALRGALGVVADAADVDIGDIGANELLDGHTLAVE